MKKSLIIIILLSLIGGILRFWDLSKNSLSLNVDEVSIGYNAYSILKTGSDEYGTPYPIFFKSLGDYKPPLYIYLTVPSIAIFGLNEFAVRFPAALLGSLSIPIFYIFFRVLTGKEKYAVFSTMLLAISPWHIYFSRIASESIVATFFVVLGALSLFKAIRGRLIWVFISAVVLVASMYTYHTQRVFVPLLLIIFTIIFGKGIYQKKKKITLFIVLSFVLIIPLIFSSISGEGNKRAQMTIITNDPVLERRALIDYKDNIGLSNPLTEVFSSKEMHLGFYMVRKFLAYFQPSFLFFNGLGMTTPGTLGLGVMYLFEIPFLINGLIWLIKSRSKESTFIYFWILIALIPAALTLSEEHPIRTLVAIPMVLLISGIGAVTLFELLKKILNRFSIKIVLGIFTLFVFWNLSLALLIFTIHFPKQKGEGFMEGTKEIVEFARTNKDFYSEVVIDPRRGIDGPYITSAPHVYLLFYSVYDPLTYQNEVKRQTENSFGFNKYTIREINWSLDRGEKNKLFIGSPWSIPLADVKDEQILKKVYLSNGKLAFIIVLTK